MVINMGIKSYLHYLLFLKPFKWKFELVIICIRCSFIMNVYKAVTGWNTKLSWKMQFTV